jgi:hypothetical protein
VQICEKERALSNIPIVAALTTPTPNTVVATIHGGGVRKRLTLVTLET